MTTIWKSFQRSSKRMISSVAAALCFSLFFAAGCSNQSGLAPAPLAVTVNIATPASTIMDAGSTVSLTASVSTGGVTWEVYGNNCFATTVGCGTLSATTGNTVQYTAPPTNPGSSTQVVEIRATSTANFTVFTTIDFTVLPVGISITSPVSRTATVKGGTSLNVTAAATNQLANGNIVPDPNGVAWTLTGTGCAGAACGSLSNITTTSVTYNAPATEPANGFTALVTATSVSDPGESVSVVITVPAAVVVTIAPPASTTVPDGSSITLTASTANDATNSGVTWSLSCTIGGTATTGTACGVLTNTSVTAATYTAPSTPSAAIAVSVKATSVADALDSSTQSLTVPQEPTVTIATPTSTTVADNSTLVLTASVANDINSAGVSWSLKCTISGTPTTGSSCGSLTNISTTSVTYNSPAVPPIAIAVTITATSIANTAAPTASQSLTVPIAPIITITSPAPNTVVTAGNTQTVTATISNDGTPSGITWSIAPNSACGANCGTVSVGTFNSGTGVYSTVYTPPSTLPTNSFNATVVATSKALSASTASLLLSVPGAISYAVVVTPAASLGAPPTIPDGTAVTFNAAVNQTNSNTHVTQPDPSGEGVTWNVLTCTAAGNPTVLTGAACGTLTSSTTSSIVYTAPYPSAALTVTISAGSNFSAGTTGASTFIVAASSVSVALTTEPSKTVVAPNIAVSLAATVSNDPSTQGVTWSLAPATGSTCTFSATTLTGTCGTLSASTATSGTAITYTSPANLSVSQSVVLTATSAGDTSKSASITLTDLTPIVFSTNVLPVATSQTTNSTNTLCTTPTYTATITLSGGTPPYSTTVTGNPSWATVTPSGANNQIITLSGCPHGTFASGTPSYSDPGKVSTGSSNLSFVATDSSAAIDSSTTTVSATQVTPLTSYYTLPGTISNPSLLSGYYAFYGAGWRDAVPPNFPSTATGLANSQLARVGYIGSFFANGGNITGEMDVNDAAGGFRTYTITGNYNAQTNQQVAITVYPPTPLAPITLEAAVSMLDSNGVAGYGQFIEFDDSTGTASPSASATRVTGELMRQGTPGSYSTSPSTPPFALSSTPVSGNYVFGMYGANDEAYINANSTTTSSPNCETNQTCGPVAAAGVMTITSGKVTASEEDIAQAVTSVPNTGASGVGLSFASNAALNSVNPDGNGRITASLPVSSTTGLIDWPSNYVIYTVTPYVPSVAATQTTPAVPAIPGVFYIMSADSYGYTMTSGTPPVTAYSGYTMLSGKAITQNITDVNATPFTTSAQTPSVATPGAVILYGNGVGAANVSTPTLGATFGTVAYLAPTVATATTGTFAGKVGAIGRTGPAVLSTNTSITTASPVNYAVDANGRVTLTGPGTFGALDYPRLYLADTNTGFGVTQPQGTSSTSTDPVGMLTFQPQTSEALLSGNYAFSSYKAQTTEAPMQAGIFTIPASTVSTTPTNTPAWGLYVSSTVTSVTDSNTIGGQVYASFQTGQAENNGDGSNLLFDVVLTGTITDKWNSASTIPYFGGTLSAITLTSGLQACGGTAVADFVISNSSFVCYSANTSVIQEVLFFQR